MTAPRFGKRQATGSSGRHAPRLSNVWIAGTLALIVAVAVGCGIYWIVEHLEEGEAKAGESIRSTLAMLTLIAAIFAGVYAYRKQRIAESEADRADDKQLLERYTSAAEQLGHTMAAVRLAGVYAMAQLADEWLEQRQVCIDVLCAYMRMPFERDEASDNHKPGEREVRQTIIRVIHSHLQDPQSPTSWSESDFDFTSARFEGADFSDCHFHGKVSFKLVIFDMWFNFTNSVFKGTTSFAAARFYAGGTTIFNGAQFSGGDVYFNALFGGAKVSFEGANFSSVMMNFKALITDGEVSFNGATFSGSEVDFAAAFEGGTVSFDGAQRDGGTVSFDGAEYGGTRIIWGEFSPSLS
ncbi:pentapeptide repeat-containing protein [Streptomyces erythrochromogenes]|uniref:pentapeptide repeat-containing protein n=1 Tax=Streptomyces erythrochromogenes TaxID=285574 RepID=UPI00369E73C1